MVTKSGKFLGNAHNTVFGGFLMRNALELSWALAFQYRYDESYVRTRGFNVTREKESLSVDRAGLE